MENKRGRIESKAEVTDSDDGSYIRTGIVADPYEVTSIDLIRNGEIVMRLNISNTPTNFSVDLIPLEGALNIRSWDQGSPSVHEDLKPGRLVSIILRSSK